MKKLASLILVTVFGGALSDPAVVLQACDPDDAICMNQLAVDYFRQTKRGIPDYGIAIIDPSITNTLDVVFDDVGATYKFKNVNVTGLNNVQLHGFKLIKETKWASISFKADMTVVSDVTIDHTKKSKTYDGSLTATAPTVGIYNFNFDVTANDKGENHFVFGPHTFKCELITSAKYDWSPELLQSIQNDDDARNLIDKEKTDKAFCKLTLNAFETNFNNIKAIHKALSASTFLKGF